MTKTSTKFLSTIIILAASGTAAFGQSSNGYIECGSTYTVVRGDSLSKINARAYGDTSFAALHQANLQVIGKNPNVIFVGQTIVVPCRDGATVLAAAKVEADDAEVATKETGPLVFTFNKASAPKFIINSGIIDLFLAEIDEVTDGRVTFTDPAEMNRDPMVQLDLVTTGEVDGAYVFNGYLGESHPFLQLPMMPLMGGSAEQTAVSLWNLHADYLSQTDYFSEAKLLGFVAAPAAHIWRRNEAPVTANQNVVEENDYAIPYFAGLDSRGPKVVQQENAAMLASHNEDANGALTFFLAHGAARAAGLWNDERTVTEIDYGIYTPTFSVVLSNEAWAQISPEDQTAIEAVSGLQLAHRSASWDAFDNGHRSHMLETGLRIAKPDADLMAELDAVSEAKVDVWVNYAQAMGLPGQQAIAAYKESLDALQDRLIFRSTPGS